MKVTEGYDEEMEIQIEKELREENILYFIDVDRFDELNEELAIEKEKIYDNRIKKNNNRANQIMKLQDNIINQNNECAYLVSILYSRNEEYKELASYVNEMKEEIEHERRMRRYTYWLNKKRHQNDVLLEKIALKRNVPEE